jgi:hypothetical protein
MSGVDVGPKGAARSAGPTGEVRVWQYGKGNVVQFRTASRLKANGDHL